MRSRWSSAEDLIEAVEQLGFDAVLASAQAGGELERVEDELFRITRALVGQREVRQALFDPRVPGDKRADLAENLLRGQGRRRHPRGGPASGCRPRAAGASSRRSSSWASSRQHDASASWRP